MAKVFTITEGLENMGAMKTGGQGSVYKGRRLQQVTTAIKLLPTPIYSESEEDKNYLDFQNEVRKLKRVNEHHNPHVVTILSSGITDSGNFPYIEMEFIDGPDLSDLLQPPHDKVFTNKEVVKVATQLSSALAHCHQLGVKHGDLKSNNIKFNNHSGNYVLLDFGLSIMSDEQRRTSLRHAGAIEFMAPEQNEGELYFQTDVYSFGVVLYELLTGNVPFPLKDKGESARNAVRLSHMENTPPEVTDQRRKAVAETSWPDKTKAQEAVIPAWITAMVNKCMAKKYNDRFSSGIELHDFIVTNSLNEVVAAPQPAGNDLLAENGQLKAKLTNYTHLIESKDNDLDELKEILKRKENEWARYSSQNTNTGIPASKKVPLGIVLVTALLAIVVGSFATYRFMNKNNNESRFAGEASTSTTGDTLQQMSDDTSMKPVNRLPQVKTVAGKHKDSVFRNVSETKNPQTDKQEEDQPETYTKPVSEPDTVPVTKEEPVTQDPPVAKSKSVGLYTVNDKAFFHNGPNESSRRNAFINHWNNAILAALNEENNFIYVVYVNKEGQTSKGWLRKSDLSRINR